MENQILRFAGKEFFWIISKLLSLLKNKTGHTNGLLKGVKDLTVLRNGHLVSCSQDKTIKIWYSPSDVITLTGMPCSVTALAALPDGSLASGSNDCKLRIWNVTNGEVKKTFLGHNLPINCLAVLSGTRIASGSSDRTIKLWNTNTGTLIMSLSAFNSSVMSLAALVDGTLASGLGDGKIVTIIIIIITIIL